MNNFEMPISKTPKSCSIGFFQLYNVPLQDF